MLYMTVVLFTTWLGIFNVRLYTDSAVDASEDAYALKNRLLPSLRFLERSWSSGASKKMQELFPEGFFFSHVLTGLTWIELAKAVPANDVIRPEALAYARVALQKLESPEGYAPFSPSLSPPYGPFYMGWKTWLQAGIIMIEDKQKLTAQELEHLTRSCSSLAKAYQNSTTPALPSYRNEAWLVDSVVAVSALTPCGSLLKKDYSHIQQRWVEQAKANLDPETGMLPHTSDPRTGKPTSGARASSMSISLRFLHYINPEWAGELYENFRETFVTSRLGIPAVQEYPTGQGEGDVDSGPLFWGVSASSSAVTAGVARIYNDLPLANGLFGIGEALGLPISLNQEKRYLFGLLPVGDAFGIWSHGASTWSPLPSPVATSASPTPGKHWRIYLHGISLLIVSGSWWLLLSRSRKTKPPPVRSRY